MSEDNAAKKIQKEQTGEVKVNTSQKLELHIVPSSRPELFRQTRFQDLVEASPQLKVKGHAFALRNWSRTGIAFDALNSEHVYSQDEKIPDVSIQFYSLTLFLGEIQIKTIRSEGQVTTYGAAFTKNLFAIENIQAAENISSGALAADQVIKEIGDLPKEFCQAIVTMRSYLKICKSTCDKQQEYLNSLPRDLMKQAEEAFLISMTDNVKKKLMEFNKSFSAMVDVEKIPAESIYHKIFQDEIYPFFAGADFARRAFEKPRGYAGDYEMMNQIYRGGFEGTDLFGKVLHNYGAAEASSESVKFRKGYFLKFYKQLLSASGTRRALSVACGPPVEVQELVKSRR